MELKRLRNGVGILDIPAYSNNVADKEYVLWCDMIMRCYSENYLKRKPTYLGCEVDDSWKIYSNFKSDICKFYGFDKQDYQMDKDLLVKGNKIYSKDTVCFLPRAVNMCIQSKNRKSNGLPVGVCFYEKHVKNKYLAYCRNNGKTIYIGKFETAEEAFYAYKSVKEKIVREVAEKYKFDIDSRAYNALINWEVNIDD